MRLPVLAVIFFLLSSGVYACGPLKYLFLKQAKYNSFDRCGVFPFKNISRGPASKPVVSEKVIDVAELYESCTARVEIYETQSFREREKQYCDILLECKSDFLTRDKFQVCISKRVLKLEEVLALEKAQTLNIDKDIFELKIFETALSMLSLCIDQIAIDGEFEKCSHLSQLFKWENQFKSLVEIKIKDEDQEEILKNYDKCFGEEYEFLIKTIDELLFDEDEYFMSLERSLDCVKEELTENADLFFLGKTKLDEFETGEYKRCVGVLLRQYESPVEVVANYDRFDESCMKRLSILSDDNEGVSHSRETFEIVKKRELVNEGIESIINKLIPLLLKFEISRESAQVIAKSILEKKMHSNIKKSIESSREKSEIMFFKKLKDISKLNEFIIKKIIDEITAKSLAMYLGYLNIEDIKEEIQSCEIDSFMNSKMSEIENCVERSLRVLLIDIVLKNTMSKALKYFPKESKVYKSLVWHQDYIQSCVNKKQLKLKEKLGFKEFENTIWNCSVVPRLLVAKKISEALVNNYLPLFLWSKKILGRNRFETCLIQNSSKLFIDSSIQVSFIEMLTSECPSYEQIDHFTDKFMENGVVTRQLMNFSNECFKKNYSGVVESYLDHIMNSFDLELDIEEKNRSTLRKKVLTNLLDIETLEILSALSLYKGKKGFVLLSSSQRQDSSRVKNSDLLIMLEEFENIILPASKFNGEILQTYLKVLRFNFKRVLRNLVGNGKELSLKRIIAGVINNNRLKKYLFDKQKTSLNIVELLRVLFLDTLLSTDLMDQIIMYNLSIEVIETFDKFIVVAKAKELDFYKVGRDKRRLVYRKFKALKDVTATLRDNVTFARVFDRHSEGGETLFANIKDEIIEKFISKRDLKEVSYSIRREMIKQVLRDSYSGGVVDIILNKITAPILKRARNSEVFIANDDDGFLYKWMIRKQEMDFIWKEARKTKGARKAIKYYSDMILLPQIMGEDLSRQEHQKINSEFKEMVLDSIPKDRWELFKEWFKRDVLD